MFARLLLLFTIIPIIELGLLIPLGQQIGTVPTLAIIAFTAIAGAWLGKSQGSSAWRRIQKELAHGELPGDSILDGLAVLVASAFLVTPGVLTDFAGFTLLIPFTRAPIKRFVRARFDTWMASSGGGVYTNFGGFGDDDLHDVYGGGPEIIDVTRAEASPEPEAARAASRPVVLDVGGEELDVEVGSEAHAKR